MSEERHIERENSAIAWTERLNTRESLAADYRRLFGFKLPPSARTGIYYDEGGAPMQGSERVCDPKFQARVAAETRAFLSAG